MLAPRYFAEVLNTCLIKLRQLAELLAPLIATRVGERLVDELHQMQNNGSFRGFHLTSNQLFLQHLGGFGRKNWNCWSHSIRTNIKGPGLSSAGPQISERLGAVFSGRGRLIAAQYLGDPQRC